jgi:WG containing repeat
MLNEVLKKSLVFFHYSHRAHLPLCLMMRFAATLLLLLMFSFPALSGKLERGFEALRIYNYFKARSLFIKAQQQHPAGAAYGLAIITSRTDNPFHDPARAHNYIQEALWSLQLSSPREKNKLSKLGITDSAMLVLQGVIDSLGFSYTEKKGTVAAWDMYIDSYCHSPLIAAATLKRNALAYTEAVGLHTWQSYQQFIQNYPDAAEVPEARARYDELLFTSSTASGTLADFVQFLAAHPESPYRLQAEDSVYWLAVPSHSVAEYHAFVKTYPANRNVPDAWKRIYGLFVNDFTAASIARFKEAFPDYPYPEQLTADMLLAQTNFYPVRSAAGLWGFSDSTGTIRIAPAYASASVFSEGLAAISNGKTGGAGYLGKSGQVVIPMQFAEAGDFENGLALVADTADKFSLIDHTGKVITRRAYDFIGSFSEGLARVSWNDCSGFIDVTGNELIACRNAEFGNFASGLAWMRDSVGRWGFINRKGETVIPPVYDRAESFSGNLPVRVRLDGRWGIINRDGQLLQPCIYSYIGPWSEGLALVVNNDKFGYVNAAGKVVVPLQYLYNRDVLGDNLFGEGTARVLLEKKAGLIDSTGKLVLPRDFDDVQPFAEGLAPVKKKDKWGYADRLQKLRIPYTYEYAWPFSNGIARVKVNGKIALIDTKGNYVAPPQFTAVTVLSSGYLLVSDSTGNKGLLDKTGVWILPCKYTDIKMSGSSNVVVVYRDEENTLPGYFDVIRCVMFWNCSEE